MIAIYIDACPVKQEIHRVAEREGFGQAPAKTWMAGT